MAILQWALICERAIIEEQTKTVSMMSLIEMVQLPMPPAQTLEQKHQAFVPMRYYIVQQWSRSNPKIGERVSARARLLGPTGEQYGELEYLVDLVATSRARIISQAIGFPLFGAGVYTCVVEANVRTKWRKFGETEFTVSFLDNPVPNRRPSRKH